MTPIVFQDSAKLPPASTFGLVLTLASIAALLLGTAQGAVIAGDDFNADANAAGLVLQKWYNAAGLWNTTGWWNAANCLDAVESLIEANNGQRYLNIIGTTFTLNSGANFLNSYYDDEGWWGLAWVRAYDLTGNARYLDTAKTIFADMKTGWDSSCHGGLWWSKDRTYKNAIPNELFLLLAIRLHQRTPGDAGPGSFLDWANQEWAWFKQSGMINQRNLINDGLDAACKNNGDTTWTYNQGVIIGGLVEMYKTTGNSNYLDQASAIADAAMATLHDSSGVLREPCEPTGCGGGDVPQFKGIFIRYLADLYDLTRKPAYFDFLFRCGHAVWFKDRTASNQLGLKWDGPFDSADAARQSSAMAPLTALCEPVTSLLSFGKGAADPAFNHPLGVRTGVLGWTCSPLLAGRADFLQYGPYLASLPAGSHAAHFRLAVSDLSTSAASLVRIDARENNGGTTLAAQDLPWSSFHSTNQAQNFILLFTNLVPDDPLEFRTYWNNVPNSPTLTLSEVTIDGYHNWIAATLDHDIGRLNGANSWEADPARDKISGLLLKGPGTSELLLGDYVADFELKVDNFNRDASRLATLIVVDDDAGRTVATRQLSRTNFPNVLYQSFPLNFRAENGKHYDFRVQWYSSATAPRLSARCVVVRPGATSSIANLQLKNGTAILSVTGVPNQSYTVEATDDLKQPHWVTLGTVSVPPNPTPAFFIDPSAGTSAQRWYRLRFP